MNPITRDLSADRAEKLFRQQLADTHRSTDLLFAKLMALQWLAGIGVAMTLSQTPVALPAALLLGGAITTVPLWCIRTWPGSTATRFVVAITQMFMSALLIALTDGRVETHFHVFGSLLLLSFYRDWRVLAVAMCIAILDHFLRGIYWPHTIYGVLASNSWRSTEYAIWVVFVAILLVIACLRSLEEIRLVAERTAALEANEQSSRTIFEQAPIGMALLDLDETFMQVNTRFCEMVGYSEAELKQRTGEDITFADDLESGRQLGQSLLGGLPRYRGDKRYVRKDGEVLWVQRTACLMRDPDGIPRRYLVMVEDISEQRRNEKDLREARDDADRANRAKSEFLSRMSHELRTPLNAILGFGQLLERQNPTDAQRTRVRYILSAGRHLLSLINEVLDISRIEAGNLQLSLEPVSVSEVLQETIDLMRPLAAERQIDLTVADALEGNCYVSADRQRLKQVMLNLLTNAVKYTPVGGRVAVSNEASGEELLRLVVSDTGPGIPVEKLPRLFTPFDRLGAEQSNVEGTGLGLALCQRLVHAMGGTIGVKSVPANGSTFWIGLPLTDSPLDRLAGQRVEHEALGADADRKVLYIEDNLSNLSLVEQMLADEAGVQLITAMQGQLGLDLARKHQPNLILLDLHLPDLPGWEVLNRLQKDESTAHIPVVVVSADATPRQIERLKTAGATAYLTKPLEMTEFYDVVGEAMRKPEAAECASA